MRAPSKTGDPRLGEAIRKARGTMRLSQEELARKVGVTQAAIGQWEAGATYPSRNHLPALVKVLNLNVPSLMLGTPIKDHRAHEPSGPDMLEEKFTLEEGPVTITFPAPISRQSYDDLAAHLELFLSKMKRRSGIISNGGARDHTI